MNFPKTKIVQNPLPFWDERPQEIDSLVFHCSAHSAKDMIAILSEKKLSAHYVIDANGDVFQLVQEEKRAWHAGISMWRGKENLNHRSIGIELSSPSMGQTTYTKQQIHALSALCLDIINRYPAISPQNIVAHSDIAPTRKPDPGIAFPWQLLATKGIGLWYDLADADKIKETDVEKLLRMIGYDTANIAAASYAFCRHFYPQAVEIISDNDLLVEHVYPQDFIFPQSALPFLQAVAYRFR